MGVQSFLTKISRRRSKYFVNMYRRKFGPAEINDYTDVKFNDQQFNLFSLQFQRFNDV